MTLPKPKKVEEPKVEQPTEQQVQVITNEQMINLKLDQIQLKIDNLPQEIVDKFNSPEQQKQ